MNSKEIEELTTRLAAQNQATLEWRATHPFQVQPSAADPAEFIVSAFGGRALRLSSGFSTPSIEIAEGLADSLNREYLEWAQRMTDLRRLLSD